MPAIIMTGVNKTGRLDPTITPSNIIGLGTVGLRTCVAVIIVGENSKRISITHHVGGLERDYSSILNEINWVGGPYIIRLVKNTIGMREGMLEVSEQLNIKTEEDFKKHDTENLIISFLRKNNLMKNLKSRTDAKTGNIVVTRDGKVSVEQPKNSELQYSNDAMLGHAIEMINNIYAGVLLAPTLEFDGVNFHDERLVQRSLYILNLLAYQLNLMKCEQTLENIYLALTKVDMHLKKIGVKMGAMIEIYGAKPSERRERLLADIKTILNSGKMPILELDSAITEGMEGAKAKQNISVKAKSQ